MKVEDFDDTIEVIRLRSDTHANHESQERWDL
jgi:hypothetical protein